MSTAVKKAKTTSRMTSDLDLPIASSTSIAWSMIVAERSVTRNSLVVSKDAARPSSEAVDSLSSSLSECVQRDASGRPQLTISLPDDNALRGLAETLALLLAKK